MNGETARRSTNLCQSGRALERVLANQERPRDLAYEPPPEKVRAFRERFGPEEQLELIGRELTWLNDQLRASANTPDRSDA